MIFISGKMLFVILVILCISDIRAQDSEKPCQARQISGQSVVCVCNKEYCDELTKDAPTENRFVAYISSQAGTRFRKISGGLKSNTAPDDKVIRLNLNPNKKYQKVEGFGGAVTDSAGINWASLRDEGLMQNLINSYFGEKGIEFNMLRVPIGGTDFSTHPYAYNEFPRDDVNLLNFTLSYEDYQYKIPMIKAIMSTAVDAVHIVATTWSPPPWMKTNENYSGRSMLKREYYQTYANYHYKFLRSYKNESIPIWGITTTNEPINGVVPLAKFNSLGWSPGNMGEWIAKNLGPTIRSSEFSDLKIITVDDQRMTIPIWFSAVIKENPDALKYIDGIGVHYYADKIIPPSVLSYVSKRHPDKFILATEACEGSFPWQTDKVLLGSWTRAKNYIIDIIADLNNYVVGWIDWNLCLNSQGGPNWVQNYVDSPIIVYPQQKEFVKQPMFYALGHFSKFIPRGSQRIEVMMKKPFWTQSVEHVAFLTPQNTVVAVIYNYSSPKQISVELNNKKAVIEMEAESVVSVEIPLERLQ